VVLCAAICGQLLFIGMTGKPRKQLWPDLGWKFVAAAGVALAIALTCTFNSLLWINRPFPGFFVWSNLFVPAVGGPDWTGYVAGVPYESRLTAIDYDHVQTATDVYVAARHEGAEEELIYTFESPDSGELIELTVPTMRLGVIDYLWSLGSYLMIGSLLTLLGFAVYVIRPDRPAARAMLVASAIWGLYLVTSADMVGPAWFEPLYLMLRAMAPVALVHLALSFPVQRGILRQRRWLLPALYLCAAAFGAADTLAIDRSFALFVQLNDVHAAAMVVGGAVLIGILVHGLLFPPSAAARQRTKIAALGGVLAFLSPVAGYVISLLMGVSIPFNLLAIPLAIFPVAIGWAIVKDDLFEVDAIIRHAVAWAILTGLIAAIYLGSVGLLEVWFAGRSSRVAQLFSLLALVAVLNPLRNQVQGALDYLFARDEYDYRKIIDEASQALATLLDLDMVVERVLTTITQTQHVELGAVWLRIEGGSYRLQAVTGPAAASLPKELEAGSALLRRVARKPQHILSEEALVGRDEPPGEQLLRLGTRLLVPMTFERRVVGLIALGAKRSGRFFSIEDLALLRTLANQGAVAVQNARSYHTLKRVNQELRDAQSRLIEAERFAAIGELSALVAHGIRNPLAGIKAAAQYAELDLPTDHPLHENIADIITEVDKLEGRIKALLDFARPFEPHPAPCDVAQMVRDALASLRNQITAQGITVLTEIDPELPQVQLDYAQIEQVLLALLSNAIEAMPRGGRLAVTAERTEAGRKLRLTVADTGAGIHPTQLPHLFDLFVTGKPSGTGLGLAFAKKIVELHGGTIRATSELALGSRFIIELPIGAAAAREEAPIMRRARSA
jgi:signal transduction histidine kinase